MQSEHYFMLLVLVASYGFFVMFCLIYMSDRPTWQTSMNSTLAAKNHIAKKANPKQFVWKWFRFCAGLLFVVAEAYGLFNPEVSFSFIFMTIVVYLVIASGTGLVAQKYA